MKNIAALFIQNPESRISERTILMYLTKKIVVWKLANDYLRLDKPLPKYGTNF